MPHRIPRLRVLWLCLLALLWAPSCRKSEAASARSGESTSWKPGEQYGYALHMASAASMSGASPALFAFDLKGSLEVTLLERTSGRDVLGFRIEAPRFGPAASEEVRSRFNEVLGDLTKNWTFTFEDGLLTEARVPVDVSVLSVGILRNLAAAFQFSPASGQGPSWKAEEYDATGRYVAEYQDDAQAGAFIKRKLRYEALVLDKKVATQFLPAQAAMPRVAMSEGAIRRKEGIPIRIQLEEELETVLTSANPLKTRTMIELELASRRVAPAIDQAALAASTRQLNADTPYLHSSAHIDLDSSKIGRLSFDQIVSGLEAIAGQGDEVDLTEKLNDDESSPDSVAAGKAWMAQRNRLFTALAATFRKEPDTVHRALGIIRSESSARDLLVSALGAAGTEAGQKALLSLMADTRRTDRQRKSAALSLVRTKVPTVFAASELERLLSDPYWKEYATFGLGTYARRLGEAGYPGELARIGTLLIRLLEESRTRAERLDALAGISNSGYPGALPSVRPLLEDGDPLIRSAAIQAIRLMDHPDIDDLVIRSLQTEGLADVRVAAVQAARNREPTPALGEALSQRVLVDENARVRMEALKLAIRWQKKLPELRAAMEEMAQREPEESIRRLVTTVVYEP
jgi:HEAT repeat protein